MQLNLPHNTTVSALDDAALATTPVQPSMLHSAAVRASELPKQALGQARQAH